MFDPLNEEFQSVDLPLLLVFVCSQLGDEFVLLFKLLL
jgi:hypothetical protein